VVLIGAMGAGKSAVGKALAHGCGVGFHDTDDAVAKAEGTAIAELFRRRGEDYFRAREHEAVIAALREQTGVVALGGGAPMRADTREALAAYSAGGGKVVLLEVSLDRVAERVALDDSRPLLSGDALARWAALLAQRRPVYEQVSDLRVGTDAITPTEAAAEVARRLGLEPGPGPGPGPGPEPESGPGPARVGLDG
jgi:shikimate kinase